MDRTYARLLLLQSILALGNSAAVVFSIVYFLDRGFSPRDVVLFNLIGFGLSSAVCVLITRTRAIPARISMAAGLAALVASYAAYLFFAGWPLLVLVAAMWGAYIPLFFLPFNAHVIAITKPEDRARKIGTFVLAYTVVAIAGPTLGGAMKDAWGYQVLFAFSSLVLLGGLVLIAQLHEASEPMRFTLDFRGLGARNAIALFAEGGFEGLSFGVVPVIAYQFLPPGVEFGGLFSLFALAGGIVTVILGTVSDRLRNRGPFLFAGATLSAASTLLVVRAGTLQEFALGQSLLSLTASLAPIFLFAMAVERLPGRPRDAIVSRELLLNAGRTSSLAAAFFLVGLGLGVQQAFVLAAACLAFVAVAKGAPRD